MPSLVSVRVCVASGAGARRARDLRHSEVEQLDARLREHDVGGLQVAVDDAVPVGLVKRVANLGCVFERAGQWQRSPLQPGLERLAIDVLHDEVVDAVLDPHVIQRADVRMIEAGDDVRLAPEALLTIRVIRELPGKCFDGDRAVQACIDGTIDLAHAAGGDQRLYFVGAEDTSNQPAGH